MKFIFVVLFVNLAFCSSLECYTCLPSFNNLSSQCNSTAVQECGPGVKYCVYVYSNTTVLAKSCLPAEESPFCESNSTGVVNENGTKKNYVCCQTDLCNAPQKISSTVKAATENKQSTTDRVRSAAVKNSMSLLLNVALEFFLFVTCFSWLKLD